MRTLYTAALVILVALMFIFIAHGWWGLSAITAFCVVVGMINGYDIIMNSQKESEADEMRWKAARFMNLSEEEKKRYYEQIDNKSEEEFEPKK